MARLGDETPEDKLSFRSAHSLVDPLFEAQHASQARCLQLRVIGQSKWLYFTAISLERGDAHSTQLSSRGAILVICQISCILLMLPSTNLL